MLWFVCCIKVHGTRVDASIAAPILLITKTYRYNKLKKCYVTVCC
jgi:hypothetical protein